MLPMTDNYIESEWWALKQIWDKGLLYKGFKIVPYCPRCGTPLSAQEVSQGYKLVKERSAIARFKVKGEDAYFLAWTTTPWTLPSNVALCTNPQDTYCKVKCSRRLYLLYGRSTAGYCSWQACHRREHLLMRSLRNLQEKIWNIKSMSRCFTAPAEYVKKQGKKASLRCL